jgi:hypothetical protein
MHVTPAAIAFAYSIKLSRASQSARRFRHSGGPEIWRQKVDIMAPRSQVAFVFAMLFAMRFFHAGGSAAPVPAKAANYRPDLWKLY